MIASFPVFHPCDLFSLFLMRLGQGDEVYYLPLAFDDMCIGFLSILLMNLYVGHQLILIVVVLQSCEQCLVVFSVGFFLNHHLNNSVSFLVCKDVFLYDSSLQSQCFFLPSLNPPSLFTFYPFWSPNLKFW